MNIDAIYIVSSCVLQLETVDTIKLLDITIDDEEIAPNHEPKILYISTNSYSGTHMLKLYTFLAGTARNTGLG